MPLSLLNVEQPDHRVRGSSEHDFFATQPGV